MNINFNFWLNQYSIAEQFYKIITQQHLRRMNIETLPADFCPICGGLIDLDTLDSFVTCHVCKNKLSFDQFIGVPITTHLTIKQNKQWLRKYESSTQKQKRGKSKMIIKQKCPKCDHPQMKYHVIQTRSADQGSTVFYECQKCGYTYSVNN